MSVAHQDSFSGCLGPEVPVRQEKRVPGTALLARKDEGAALLMSVLVHISLCSADGTKTTQDSSAGRAPRHCLAPFHCTELLLA